MEQTPVTSRLKTGRILALLGILGAIVALYFYSTNLKQSGALVEKADTVQTSYGTVVVNPDTVATDVRTVPAPQTAAVNQSAVNQSAPTVVKSVRKKTRKTVQTPTERIPDAKPEKLDNKANNRIPNF